MKYRRLIEKLRISSGLFLESTVFGNPFIRPIWKHLMSRVSPPGHTHLGKIAEIFPTSNIGPLVALKASRYDPCY